MISRVCRVVRLGEGLLVVVGFLGHHDAIDEDAGDLHLPRVQGSELADALDLDDDHAARIVGRHGDRQRLQSERLPLHGDVAVGVGGRAPDDADVDGEGLVEEILLPADGGELDQVLLGDAVELAAAVAGIDEGAKADARDLRRLAGGDVAEEVRENALGKIVGLDLLGDGELLQLGRQPPVTADHAAEHSLAAEVIQATVLAIALTGGIDECEPLGRARG